MAKTHPEVRSYRVSLSTDKELAIQISGALDVEEITFALDWLRLAIAGLEREKRRLEGQAVADGGT
jgi:hypothetical protein